MTTFAIFVAGISLIILIIWWFILAKPKIIRVHDHSIEIKVQNGVYDPAIIQAKKGETLHLHFLRLDKTPCSEMVIFNKLNISATLPIGKIHVMTLVVKEKGEYEFTCQMGMYRGKLIIS